MHWKKKIQGFFTLNRYAEGFTLVELIVVIAILAILAGVAIPAYSGYVAKANEAADLQLLGAINTAFAAACIENGTNAASLEDGSVDVVWTEKCVTGVTLYNEEFQSYYGTNATTAFKVYEDLEFVGGVFVVPGEGGDISLDLPGGGILTLTAEQFAMISQSTYKDHIESLLLKVDEMGGLVQGLMGLGDTATAALNEFKSSEEYLTNIITALGGTVDPNATLSELKAQYNDVLGKYKEEQVKNAIAAATGKDPKDVNIMGADRQMYNQLKDPIKGGIDKNVLILGVAQSAANASKDGALSIINSSDPKQLLIDAMTGSNTTANGMGNAALVYGMYTAYANSNAATDAAKNAVRDGAGPTEVFNVLNGDELTAFQNYLKTDQGKKDADACVAAMQAINNTASNADAVNGVLVNGFADPELIEAMENLFK